MPGVTETWDEPGVYTFNWYEQEISPFADDVNYGYQNADPSVISPLDEVVIDPKTGQPVFTGRTLPEAINAPPQDLRATFGQELEGVGRKASDILQSVTASIGKAAAELLGPTASALAIPLIALAVILFVWKKG